MLGRLAPGVSANEAAAEFTVLAERLASEYPDTNRDRTAVVLPEMTARTRLDQGGADGVTVILGLVGLVLLLACANVANLVLSRNAYRLARRRLARSDGCHTHATGSTIVDRERPARLAGGGGRAHRRGMGDRLSLARHHHSERAAVVVDFRLDARVLAVTAAATFVAAILTGLVPALHTSRTSLNAVLKQRPDPLPRRVTPRTALVVAQVAISVLVLVVAGLMVQAVECGTTRRSGIPARSRTAAVLQPWTCPLRLGARRAFYQQLVERTREVPGVEAVGLTRFRRWASTTAR